MNGCVSYLFGPHTCMRDIELANFILVVAMIVFLNLHVIVLYATKRSWPKRQNLFYSGDPAQVDPRYKKTTGGTKKRPHKLLEMWFPDET